MAAISANVTSPQITASVGESVIGVTTGSGVVDVTVSGGIGPAGPVGPAGTTTWVGITDKPTEFNPSLHAARHAIGGVDYIAPAAIGAATIAAAESLQLQIDGKAANSHTHSASAITSGTINSSRLPAATASAAGAIIVGTGLSASSGILSVTYGSTSTSACRGDDARLSNSREWSASTVSQADAEAGTSTSRFAFTPLRVFQAIAAWWSGSAAKTKLDGIASGATANQTDAYLLSRANHTGTQTASTISDFTAAVVAAAPPTTDASLLTSGTLPDQRLSGNIARTSDITAAVSAVIDAAPAALDTLNELAAALGDDANFASTVTNAIAAKADAVHVHAAGDITSGTLASSLMPIATANALGAVRVGSGIEIDQATGVISVSIPSLDWANITNVPASFPPDAHAASHGVGGADELYDQSLNTTDSAEFAALTVSTTSINSDGTLSAVGVNGAVEVSWGATGVAGVVIAVANEDAPTTDLSLANGSVEFQIRTESRTEACIGINTSEFHVIGGGVILGRFGVGAVQIGAAGSEVYFGEGLAWFDAAGNLTAANFTPFDGSYNSLTDLPTLGTASAAAVEDFAPAIHSHALADITDAGTAAAASASDFAAAVHEHAWSDLTSGVPSVFPPDTHTHTLSEITDAGTAAAASATDFAASVHEHAWSDITSGVPSVFPPDAHSHTAADITDFSSAVVAAAPVTSVNGQTGAVTVSAAVDVRTDTVDSTSYIGRAAPGSATSASVWKIRRTILTSAGAVSSTATATNVAWDDRLTASYS